MDSRFRRTSVMAYLVAIAMLLISAEALAVPACPIPITLTQPDGTSFRATLWGDEWLNGAETMDGYAVVQDQVTGYWEYARRSVKGDLMPSGLRPGPHDPAIEGIERGLRPSLGMGARGLDHGDVSLPAAAPSVETVNVPVILITFSDRTPKYSMANFQDLLFGDHPSIATGPGSMKDYYEEVSYGAFSVSSGPAGVQGWFTASNGHDYYGRKEGSKRAAELVAEAVRAADATIDFSQYDNDGDGYVDALIVVHQGMGTESTNDMSDIWSHQWYLSAAGHGPIMLDGVLLDAYTIQPEECWRWEGVKSISSVGVFAHEFGHALGLPDLYDYDGSSQGVGDWCLMAGGSWNWTYGSGDTPAHMSAWCKWRLGWVDPVPIRGYQADWVFYASALSDSVIQFLPNPGGPHDWHWYWGGTGEYFLVENRYKTGFDEGLPGSGLAIWHIDERRTNNDDENHKLVDLEEADGLRDLDFAKRKNRGDAGDLYPGTSDNRRFGDLTVPDNWWYDYRNTGCSVRNISDPGPVMTADVSLNCACTGPSYDDIGLLLWLLDEDYFELRRDYARLEDPEFLGLFNSVYINCTDDLTVTPEMANALRTFVYNGGGLLATDWAYPVIARAFPGRINFLGEDPRIGVAGQITAVNAQDRSLARYMGEDATTIELDLGYWAVIDSVAAGVDVALTGDVRVDPTNPPRFGSASGAPRTSLSEEPHAGASVPKGVETLRGKPLVASFEYGKGRVLYSSPHLYSLWYTGAPHSNPERAAIVSVPRAIGGTSLERLVLWNTLATLTGSEALATEKAVEACHCSLIDKVIDAATLGRCNEYEICHAADGTLAIMSATSRGTVEMTAYDPEGRAIESVEVGHTPVTMLIPNAAPGTWILHVRACQDDGSSVPFVVCIGESAQSGPELAEGEVRFGPNPANAVLNVYYSLSADAELMVYDVAGRMVYTCRLSASDHQLVWDLTTKGGAPLANGLYLAVVRSKGKAVGKPFRLVVQR